MFLSKHSWALNAKGFVIAKTCCEWMVPCTAEAHDVPKSDVTSGNTRYAAHFGLYPPPPPPHTCPRHAANTDHNSEIAFSLKLVFSQIRLAIYTTCLTAVETNTRTSVPLRFLQDWSVRLFTSGNRQLCTGLCPYVTGLKFTFSLVRSTSFPQ